MEAIVASGPIARGSGVYFKLRPSRRASLEGSRDFCLILRVPQRWRADYLWLFCEAWTSRRGGALSIEEGATTGRQNFLVALYLEGDEPAREAAAELAQADLELRRIAALRQDEIQRRSFPTLAHRVGAAMSLVTPQVPSDWLAQVLYRPASQSKPNIVAPLPKQVRAAAERFMDAKRRVYELGGWSYP
jgi:hypothetical protein